MSLLRTVVLVLLTLLLPLRGLMAATVPCADDGPPAPAVAFAGHGTGTLHAPAVAPAHDAAAGADASTPCHDEPGGGEDDGTPGTCHACASGCCMASILGTSALPPVPAVVVTTQFPTLSPRVVAVPPRGLDRPPRTA